MRLQHPHIVKCFDYGELDETHGQWTGVLYLAMELLDAQDLMCFVEGEWAQPVERVLDLLEQASDALDYCHAQGVLHRDIKLQNIMLDRVRRHVTLMDFGLARAKDSTFVTKAGKISGTPSYMAPELLLGGTHHEGSDIFALGVVGYWMATGQRPFHGPGGLPDLFVAILQQEPPPIRRLVDDVPAPLEDLILRLLNKQPIDIRQPSADPLGKSGVPSTQPRVWCASRGCDRVT